MRRMMKMKIIIDRSNIDSYLNYWKQKLGLQPWEIVVKFDKVCEENDATVNYKVDREMAVIHMKELIFYDGKEFDYDMELNLVHELVHIVIAECNRATEETDEHEEKLVERMAKAMVNARRDGNEIC